MTRKKRVAAAVKPAAAKPLWAYGYEMVAPHPEDRMPEIRDLLERQNGDAAREGRTWTARLVARRVMHVLIVSANPEMDVDINRKLEAELTELGIRYFMTVPMRVIDGDDAGA